MKNKNKDIASHNEQGLPHGYWETYWSNGKLWYKGTFVNFSREGYWEKYHSNGRPHYKGHYINGDKVGYWETYRSNGTLKEQIFYA